jgi:hypothetical protein
VERTVRNRDSILRRSPQRRGAREEPAWLKLAGHFGKTNSARSETRRIQQSIDAEFERIEPE